MSSEYFIKKTKMGLDQYLYRIPKVKSMKELKSMNAKLDNAYVKGKLLEELKKIQKQKEYIYEIDFNINLYVDIEKWKKDKRGWGNIIDLNIRVAYWRKFNALHSWMVENVQNGKDDCGDYIVTIDHLKQLKEEIEKINEENKEEVFPTASGFFFGGTDYDEYYWDQVNRYLIYQQPSDTTYIYSSSW